MKDVDCRGLSSDEKKRLDEFISVISTHSSNSSDIRHLAFCFLAARKFSVSQALELYQNYQTMLAREFVPQVIDPFDEDVRRELLSGKFMVLNDHELSGARVAQFFVRLHGSTHSNRALLQSILFQMNAAFKTEAAARSGLVFIYDMTDAKFANVDCAFGIKLFKLLQFSYPVRLRRILILTAPLWFRASFRMMRGLIREELRDIVSVLRPAPGTKLDSLSHPDFVQLRREHYAWLQTALGRMGCLLTESEQVTKPSGVRPQTAAAFFGHSDFATTSSNSLSDASDAADESSREGDDDGSCPMDDEDDLMSMGDVDPFALSSSYSSEADSASAGDLVISDDPCESVNHPESAVKRRKESNMSTVSPLRTLDACATQASHSHSDHAETPTPPSVVKRFVLPVNTASGCLSTTNSSVDKDVGFSESVSPEVVESVTPTADATDRGCLSHGGSGYAKVSMRIGHRDSTGAESSCSSITSFFSTGSAGLSSAIGSQRSTDCSPTSEQMYQRSLMSRAGARQLKVDPSVAAISFSDGSMRQIAPLAEDEVGDQSMRQEKGVDESDLMSDMQHLPLHPLTEVNLPSWAFCRPRGSSIHTGPATNACSFSGESLSMSSDTPVFDSLRPVTEVPPSDFQTSDVVDLPSEIGEPAKSTQSTLTDPDVAEDRVVLEGDPELEYDVDELSDNSETNTSISFDDYWMTPLQIAKHVQEVNLAGIHAEYNAVVRTKCDDPRSAFKHIENREKNRYCDVFCYEGTRVHLRPTSLHLTSTSKCPPRPRFSSKSSSHLHRTLSAPVAAKDLVRNYIHANWVDGYRQKNAFICTQGPLAETVADFWQMIWDYHIPVIVMITKVFEADRVKCFPYWPDALDKKLTFACGHSGVVTPDVVADPTTSDSVAAEFDVVNTACEVGEHFNRNTLQLIHLRSGQRRSIEHYAYFSWPDHGVPQTTDGLLKLLSSVQASYMDAIHQLGYVAYMDQQVPPPPVVVHCSAGIGRTGTYVTADICTKWLVDCGGAECLINIPLTASRVRSQRYGCIQVAAQYVFCYRVVLDFAVNAGFLDVIEAQEALQRLTPASVSPIYSSVASSFYHSVSSLPRAQRRPPFGSYFSPSVVGGSKQHYVAAALAEFRNILPSGSDILSIWDAMRAKRDQELNGAVTFLDSDFAMTENLCSDVSDSDNSSCLNLHEHYVASDTDSEVVRPVDQSHDAVTAASPIVLSCTKDSLTDETCERNPRLTTSPHSSVSEVDLTDIGSSNLS